MVTATLPAPEDAVEESSGRLERDRSLIVILMGVSGSGKTTVGTLLARRLGWRFIEADDFHSPEEIQHMLAGQPLSDAERQPWLAQLRRVLIDCVARQENAVLACSALKESYRRQLTVDRDAVRFVYLKGTPDVIRQRLRHRTGHFAKENLLTSQYATLEEPGDALTIAVDDEPERLAQRISDALSLGLIPAPGSHAQSC
jgi:gluconokinase